MDDFAAAQYSGAKVVRINNQEFKAGDSWRVRMLSRFVCMTQIVHRFLFNLWDSPLLERRGMSRKSCVVVRVKRDIQPCCLKK
jgi:hypothetical protein